MKKLLSLAFLVALLFAFQPTQVEAQTPHPEVSILGQTYGGGFALFGFWSGGDLTGTVGVVFGVTTKSALTRRPGMGPIRVSLLVALGYIVFDEDGNAQRGPNLPAAEEQENPAPKIEKPVGEPAGTGG